MRGAIPPFPQYIFMAWCLITGTTLPLPSHAHRRNESTIFIVAKFSSHFSLKLNLGMIRSHVFIPHFPRFHVSFVIGVVQFVTECVCRSVSI
jgi:hypothetical protein